MLKKLALSISIATSILSFSTFSSAEDFKILKQI
ncbi:hypothetical protein SAMN05216500_101221 [Acinetobacter sp. DSM 11652]|nr:hypothetical protein SAMN05216500_101221 [Acinetobacter sp. DSM 11652]